MADQLYYEDVQVGQELPELRKHPTTRQLAKWAGASTDYAEIHYDKDFAQSHGLPMVVVHGQLAASFLCELVTDWISPRGKVKKFGFSYRGMNFPGEDLVCKGRVTGKHADNGTSYAEVEVWTENPRGDRTVIGSAVVSLPSKG
jgi:acyl dehydratase